MVFNAWEAPANLAQQAPLLKVAARQRRR